MVRVSVWCEPVSGIVVGYYAIVPTNVAPGGLTRKVRGGYSGPIPGYLIAKLALSRDLHGGGYGADLLLDALEAVAAAAAAKAQAAWLRTGANGTGSQA